MIAMGYHSIDGLDHLRWHALRIQPGKELTTARIMENRSVVARYPARIVKRRKHNRGKATVPVAVPSLSGFMFVGFDAAKPVPWWKVMSPHVVCSVVSVARVPAVLSFAELHRLFASEDFLRHQIAVKRRVIKVGQSVQIANGPLAGFGAKVQDATEAELVVLCQLFGRETRVRITVDSLVDVDAAQEAA